jgi:hypothetical protein
MLEKRNGYKINKKIKKAAIRTGFTAVRKPAM